MSRYTDRKTTRTTNNLQRVQLIRHLLQTTFGGRVYHALPLSPAPHPLALPPKPAALRKPALLAKLSARKISA